MGTAGFVKEPGKKDLVPGDYGPADRTDPDPIPFETINTADNMHHPVLSLPHGRKSGGLYPFPRGQPGGTNRAGLGGTRGRPGVFRHRKGPLSFLPAAGDIKAGFMSHSEKKGIAKPEEEGADNHQSKQLNPSVHTCLILCWGLTALRPASKNLNFGTGSPAYL
jgi:hypothetical protein